MIELITIVAIFLVIITVILLRRVTDLKKVVNTQTEQINTHKMSRENFALEMAKVHNNSDNTSVDPTTELLTKNAFNAQFDHLITNSKTFSNNTFALSMIDIASMQRTSPNDQLNPDIIVEAGRRIKNQTRGSDVACHLENGKFLILFSKMIKPEVIVHGIERIIDDLHRPYVTKNDNRSHEMNIHAGISIFPFDGNDKKTLLENATNALNKAKLDGKNLFQFYQESTQMLGERELTLKSAVRSPEFLDNVTLEYRPFYDAQTNEVVCIHVTASLTHSELGKISYDEFLRIAHYSSKMFEFYEWMIESAIKKFQVSSEFKVKNKRFVFSFNLKLFEIPHFLVKIVNIIQKLTTENNEIIMEIEDDEIEVPRLEAFRKTIQTINQSNIPIAIGILVLGHFALNKLNQVRFSYLKIDKKLVADLGKRQESQLILERIMALVESLHIQTLTSGVDDKDQKLILESLGCRMMQGKFFNKRAEDSFFIEKEPA